MHALEADGSLAWIGEKPRNLADNPNFSNPINQRGIVSGQTITNWNYFIDRWRVRADSGTINFLDNAIETSAIIGQPLDPEILKTGEIVTAAAKWADGTICVVTGTISRTNVYSHFYSEMINGHDIHVSDEGNGVDAVFNISAGTIKWAALYRGSYTAKTLPPWIAPDATTELSRCKTLFNVIPSILLKGIDNLDATIMFNQMRIAPTATIYSQSGTKGKISILNDATSQWNDVDVQLSTTNETIRLESYNGTGLYFFSKIELSSDM